MISYMYSSVYIYLIGRLQIFSGGSISTSMREYFWWKILIRWNYICDGNITSVYALKNFCLLRACQCLDWYWILGPQSLVINSVVIWMESFLLPCMLVFPYINPHDLRKKGISLGPFWWAYIYIYVAKLTLCYSHTSW